MISPASNPLQVPRSGVVGGGVGDVVGAPVGDGVGEVVGVPVGDGVVVVPESRVKLVCIAITSKLVESEPNQKSEFDK